MTSASTRGACWSRSITRMTKPPGSGGKWVCPRTGSSGSRRTTISGKWGRPVHADPAPRFSLITANTSGAGLQGRRKRTAIASSRSGTLSSCKTSSSKTETMRKLEMQSIDTGMGLERIGALLQDKHDNYGHRHDACPDRGKRQCHECRSRWSGKRAPQGRGGSPAFDIVPGCRWRHAVKRGQGLRPSPDHAARNASRAHGRRNGPGNAPSRACACDGNGSGLSGACPCAGLDRGNTEERRDSLSANAGPGAADCWTRNWSNCRTAPTCRRTLHSSFTTRTDFRWISRRMPFAKWAAASTRKDSTLPWKGRRRGRERPGRDPESQETRQFGSTLPETSKPRNFLVTKPRSPKARLLRSFATVSPPTRSAMANPGGSLRTRHPSMARLAGRSVTPERCEARARGQGSG